MSGRDELERVLLQHRDWTDEVDNEHTTETTVIWRFRCRCGTLLQPGIADRAHVQHLADVVLRVVENDSTPAHP